MVKLSEIHTADELVLALARQGWAKTCDGNPSAANPAAPFFSFDEWFHPIAEERGRQFSLYPQVLDHGSDLGFSAMVDEAGLIGDWAMFECHGGTVQPIDPAAVELHHFNLGERLDDWQRSWHTGTWGER